jgi:riboflavin kinase/FMN adenylyltransferase
MVTIFIRSLKDVKRFKNPVVAIGIFDGVHQGHQQLIKKIITQAKKFHGTSVVLTFFPHPIQVLHKKFDLSLLVSLEHRLKIIESLGVDACVVVHFTRHFAKQSAEDFIKTYLAQGLDAKEVFIGKNFHFGRNRCGNSNILKSIAKKYEISAKVLASVRCQSDIISSSRLRILVKKGNLRLAKKYLGRDVSTLGTVVHGDGRGNQLGFPTANINSGTELLPPTGVYIVKVLIAKKIFQGIANVGHRPSFKKKSNKVVEAHIFHFHKNIYGKKIEIQFIKKIRDEKKFSCKKDLCLQIENDKKLALQYFADPESSVSGR